MMACPAPVTRRGLGRPSTAADLEARVWMAVDLADRPDSVADAIHRFLPKCTFGVRDDVPTARICGGEVARIEFGTRFLDEELNDDRDFLFVLMHEIYHHVLGHLRHSRGDRASRTFTNLANIAADMLVNRAVCEAYFPHGVPLLGRMYADDSLPSLLLLPPPCGPGVPVSSPTREGILKRIRTALAEIGANPKLAHQVWAIYSCAWFGNVPYETLLEKLLALFAKIDSLQFMTILLIGNHEGIETPDVLYKIARRGGHGGSDGCGYGPGGDEEEDRIEIEKATSDRQLGAALRRAVEAQAGRYSMDEPQRIPGVVCVPGRRDAAFLAGGTFPVIYQAATPVYDPLKLAHVYLDVSGSFDEYLPRIMGLLNGMRDQIADPIHQFSTVVADISLARLSQGAVHTSGGTDFNCILADAMARKYRQIIVITDGIGAIDGGVTRAFRAAKTSLHLVLVGSAVWVNDRCPLVPLAASFLEMKG